MIARVSLEEDQHREEKPGLPGREEVDEAPPGVVEQEVERLARLRRFREALVYRPSTSTVSEEARLSTDLHLESQAALRRQVSSRRA